jgi:hypothetical protein
VIGFGHIAEPDFYIHLPAMLPKSFRPQAAWGTGNFPSKQYFDIKMRCLRQRRHRRQGLCGAVAPFFTLLSFYEQ